MSRIEPSESQIALFEKPEYPPRPLSEHYLTTHGTGIVRLPYRADVQRWIEIALADGPVEWGDLHRALEIGADLLSRHLTMMEHTEKAIRSEQMIGAPMGQPGYRGFKNVFSLPEVQETIQ